MVFLKDFLEKVNYKKKKKEKKKHPQTTKKNMQNYPACKELEKEKMSPAAVLIGTLAVR